MDLLDEMKAIHLPPNAVVYNSLISELARQGEVKKSFKLYNRVMPSVYLSAYPSGCLSGCFSVCPSIYLYPVCYL